MTTHRFQPQREMDDEWLIIDIDHYERTTRTFSRDTALMFCFALEQDPDRKQDVASWRPYGIAD